MENLSPASSPSAGCLDAQGWVDRFLADLAVVRSVHTVRAYRHDLARWVAFCRATGRDVLRVRPHVVFEFIRVERERTISPRTIVRRLAAIRQWYDYLALDPESTGVHRNPIPGGTALRTGAGIVARRPALLRYDLPLPEVLSTEAIERFINCLTATRYRDRALVWLLMDGGMRISELLSLRLGNINWGKRTLTVRAGKSRAERLVPVSQDAITALANYLRFERPRTLEHDHVFVNLGRRGFGRPFRYSSWAYICERARAAAATPDVHAHAFRHTFATNMAEGGMPLDTLRRLLGHESLETVMVYNQVRDSRLYAEYQKTIAGQEAKRASQKVGDDR